MSKSKKVFSELCSDAAEQFSAGVKLTTLQANIAYFAEHYGIPMFQSIEISEILTKALVNLNNNNISITDTSVAQEFFKIVNSNN